MKNVVLDVPYRHIKTGKIYYAASRLVINATNTQNGEAEVIIYTDGQLIFVREVTEFKQKFEAMP